MDFTDIEKAIEIKEGVEELDTAIVNMQELVTRGNGFSFEHVSVQFQNDGNVDVKMYKRIGETVIAEFAKQKQLMLDELRDL